jgi:hypothetical protein
MTTTTHDTREPVATPMVFSHVGAEEPTTRATTDERVRPVRFCAPSARPQR